MKNRTRADNRIYIRELKANWLHIKSPQILSPIIIIRPSIIYSISSFHKVFDTSVFFFWSSWKKESWLYLLNKRYLKKGQTNESFFNYVKIIMISFDLYIWFCFQFSLIVRPKRISKEVFETFRMHERFWA